MFNVLCLDKYVIHGNNMADAEKNARVSQVGRPRKYSEGYVQSSKRLYVLEATFHEWRSIKWEMDLSSDDEVAKYLLACRKAVLANAQEDTLSCTCGSDGRSSSDILR